jgi:glycoside/pentoside/hexuronide:cation symporter, GPH family
LKGLQHVQSPLSAAIKLGWALGDAAIAGHMAIISIFLLFYLTEVHHFPGTLAGTLILVPRLWNIVLDPVVGGISDRWRSRWGRRRPFLLCGALVWSVSFAAMFSIPPDLNLSQKAVWFLVTFFAANTGLSLYYVPFMSMAAEMTRDYDERLSLIGYKEIVSRSTVMLTIMASPLLVKLAPDALAGNRWVGLATGALIVLSAIVAFVATERAPAVQLQPQTLSWSEQIRTFKANRPLLILSGAGLFSSTCDAFYSALLIYFVTIALGLPSSSMGFLYPAGSFAAILATMSWARCGSRWGKRQACIAAFGGGACCFLLSLLIPDGHPWALLPFMGLLGLFFGGIFLLPGAMVPDTVEYDEKISGLRREGTIYGAWIFTMQTGMSLGTFLVGVYLDVIGHGSRIAGAASDEAFRLKLGFGLIPALLLACAIVMVRRYPLDRPGRAHGPSSRSLEGPQPVRAAEVPES